MCGRAVTELSGLRLSTTISLDPLPGSLRKTQSDVIGGDKRCDRWIVTSGLAFLAREREREGGTFVGEYETGYNVR